MKKTFKIIWTLVALIVGGSLINITYAAWTQVFEIELMGESSSSYTLTIVNPPPVLVESVEKVLQPTNQESVEENLPVEDTTSQEGGNQ